MRTGNKNEVEELDFQKDINNKKDTKSMVVMTIWLLVLVFVIYQIVVLVRYTIGKEEKGNMWLYNSVNKVVGIFVSKSPSQTVEESSLKVAGLGDIYTTRNTLSGAKSSDSYDFTKGTENISNKLKGYDLVLASLNTPIAGKALGYSAKSVYNAPKDLLDTMKALNISVVATATAHAMDKGEVGIDNTISAIEEAGIKQTGTNSKNIKDPLVIEKNNISIGVLSYATKSYVKYTAKQDYVLNILDENTLKKDMEYLKSKNVDFVIAYLNVPNEDNILTSSSQKKNTDMLFNAGVNVVLGTGSKVVHENTEDEIVINDKKQHVYAIYSLGDFMGSYATDDNMLSVIASFEFTKKVTKNKKGEIIETTTDMKIEEPTAIWSSITSKYAKTMYILNDEIEAYNNDKSSLTAKEFKKLKDAKERLVTLFD